MRGKMRICMHVCSGGKGGCVSGCVCKQWHCLCVSLLLGVMHVHAACCHVEADKSALHSYKLHFPHLRGAVVAPAHRLIWRGVLHANGATSPLHSPTLTALQTFTHARRGASAALARRLVRRGAPRVTAAMRPSARPRYARTSRQAAAPSATVASTRTGRRSSGRSRSRAGRWGGPRAWCPLGCSLGCRRQ